MVDAVIPKRDPNRPDSDFYPTLDGNVTKALTRFLSEDLGILQPFSTIWECACGEGHMAETLQEEDFNVVATTLEDMGYGETLYDFLREDPPEDFDWIITNPPFRHAGKFINKCQFHGKPFALLLKSTFWHAEIRRNMFERISPQWVSPLTWRPNFYPEERQTGSPTMEVSWFVWDGTWSKETRYKPICRPE